MTSHWEFHLLGPLEVHYQRVSVPIRAAKQRALLALLLIEANRPVSADKLIDSLWGESPPPSARNALQNHVLRLRRALLLAAGDCLVSTHVGGYLMRVDPDAVDAHQFTALLGQAGATEDVRDRSALLHRALGLWRGDPLSDVPNDILHRTFVPLMAEYRLRAVELRVDADLTLGQHADVLAELRALTAAYPLRERFWAQRMLALYRAGRRGEALECYRVAARLFADELGIDPCAELRELHQAILTADPALAGAPQRAMQGTPRRPPDMIPAEVASFVGREKLVTQARRLLQDVRLITLTGLGGVGKTRLARRLAATVSDIFPDGVRLLDLTDVPETELADRMADAADGAPGHPRLLILDNCDHQVEYLRPRVIALLHMAPGLRVLATSRQRLSLPGEHVLPVPPLMLPASQDYESARASEAVRLLVDRATAADADFRLTEANYRAVTRLCQRLEGIPLAIELAAVRLRTLSIDELLIHAGDRFRLLTGTRVYGCPAQHRSLRETLDASWRLCSVQERRLWARLSVFTSGFDLAGVENVCTGDGIEQAEVMDLLTALVDKSIVTVSRHDRSRYQLLDTIREYGQIRLAELGQRDALLARHSDYCRGLAAAAADAPDDDGRMQTMARLRDELLNLRAALEFCVRDQGRQRTGLEIATDLARARYWFVAGSLGEGRQWLTRFTASAAPEPAGANAVAWAAFTALCQGQRVKAQPLLKQCRELAKDLPELHDTGVMNLVEGVSALLSQGHPRAVQRLDWARKQFRGAGAPGDTHLATVWWVMAASLLGDLTDARVASSEFLADARASGSGWARSYALWCAGLTRLRDGQSGPARAMIRACLRDQQEIGDRWLSAWSVEAMAWAVGHCAQYEQSARLLGAAHRLRAMADLDITGLTPFRHGHADAEQRIVNAVGTRCYAAAFKNGAAVGDGVQLALDGG
jgi:predicted ATPase/DNA-binding SARP family transcriptional activator